MFKRVMYYRIQDLKKKGFSKAEIRMETRLNMVECWFSEITSKKIRRGSFKNVKELIMVIKQYIDSHNQNPKFFI